MNELDYIRTESMKTRRKVELKSGDEWLPAEEVHMGHGKRLQCQVCFQQYGLKFRVTPVGQTVAEGSVTMCLNCRRRLVR